MNISGPGPLRAAREAQSARKQLMFEVRWSPSGHVVGLGYYIVPSNEEPPQTTSFRPDEVIVSVVDSERVDPAGARLEIGFDHPKPQERHMLIDIPAGAAAKIRLRVLYRVQQRGVSAFVIQVEVTASDENGGRAKPVVRYDCSHGFLHRDMIASDGTKTKVPLHEADVRAAVPTLITEIQEHLAEWLSELGYKGIDTPAITPTALRHELCLAQGTLLRLMDDPDSFGDVESRLVTFPNTSSSPPNDPH